MGDNTAMVGIVAAAVVCVCCSVSAGIALSMDADAAATSNAATSNAATSNAAVIEYIVADESHLSAYKAGIIELGAGDSVDKCRQLAYDADYPAFGWRKKDNTCWAIIDGDTKGLVTPLADHVVGCVSRGEDIDKDGCSTTKTNVIRATHIKGVTATDNITCNSIESCRSAAKTAGANHFGWREAGNNGWIVKSPDIKTLNPEFMVAHTIGCTDPTKKFPD